MFCSAKFQPRNDLGKEKSKSHRKNFKVPLNINCKSSIEEERRKTAEDFVTNPKTRSLKNIALASKVPVPVASNVVDCTKGYNKFKSNGNKNRKDFITRTISNELNESTFQSNGRFKLSEKQYVGLCSDKDIKIQSTNRTQAAILLPNKGILKRNKWSSSCQNLNLAKENWNSHLRKNTLLTEKYLPPRKVTFKDLSSDNLSLTNEKNKFGNGVMFLKKSDHGEQIIEDKSIVENSKCNLVENQKSFEIHSEDNKRNINNTSKNNCHEILPIESNKTEKLVCDKSFQTGIPELRETGVQYSPPINTGLSTSKASSKLQTHADLQTVGHVCQGKKNVSKASIEQEINDKIRILTTKFLKEIKSKKRKIPRFVIKKEEKLSNAVNEQAVESQSNTKSSNCEKDKSEEKLTQSKNNEKFINGKINTLQVTLQPDERHHVQTCSDSIQRGTNTSPNLSQIPRPNNTKNEMSLSSPTSLNVDNTHNETKTDCNSFINQIPPQNENIQKSNLKSEDKLFCGKEMCSQEAQKVEDFDVLLSEIGETLNEKIGDELVKGNHENRINDDIFQDTFINKKIHSPGGFNKKEKDMKFSNQNNYVEVLDNYDNIPFDDFNEIKNENDELIRRYLHSSLENHTLLPLKADSMNGRFEIEYKQEENEGISLQKTFFSRNRKLLGIVLLFLLSAMLFQSFL